MRPPMEPFRAFAECDTSAMRWVRSTSDRHEFDLRSGELLLARLVFAGSVGSLARAELWEAQWTLKRGGFLQPHVTVRGAEGTEVARLSAHLTGGILTTPAGRSFRFHRTGLLVPAWQFYDAAGRAVVHVEPVSERGRLQGGLVQTDPSMTKAPELPAMTITGWYFIVLAWLEDEAVHAAQAVLQAASNP